MQNSKTTRLLFYASVVAIALNLASLDLWGTASLLYLIWNIFLAWIPYVISFYFIRKDLPVKRFIPFFILWLLFFPNAPYLVTDVFHLSGRISPALWYDGILFFFFGWIGLLLGTLSLFQIHQYIKAHLSHKLTEIIIFLICLISSFGIYLGRFERWNSWDIFTSPLELAKHSFYLSANFMHTGAPFLFVTVFTIFMYTVYKVTYTLVEEKIEL